MIQFFYQDTDFVLQETKEVTAWIKQIAKEYEYAIREVNFIFCSDDYLLKLNRERLKHDYYTDILTFDYSEGDKKRLHSDIYISTDRVADNARDYGVSFQDELHRVIAHGILHLVGFNDHDEISKQEMTNAEDEALAQRTFVVW